MGTITSGGGSGALDPLNNPQAFDYVTIAGQKSPGLLKHIEGFSRDTTWQDKSGKGSKGAASTLVALPPACGALVFELWTALHFQQWAVFSQLFIITATPGASADSQALEIVHPFLADVNVTSVLPRKLHPKKHVGKGKWVVRVDLLEFVPVPKQSVVFTPTLTSPNPKSTMPASGYVEPSALQKLKTAQAALFQQLQSSP